MSKQTIVNAMVQHGSSNLVTRYKEEVFTIRSQRNDVVFYIMDDFGNAVRLDNKQLFTRAMASLNFDFWSL